MHLSNKKTNARKIEAIGYKTVLDKVGVIVQLYCAKSKVLVDYR